MAKTLAVANQKGGVGKTATADNVAFCLADSGERTLLIDLDPTPSSSKVFCSSLPEQNNIIEVLSIKGYDINRSIYKAVIQGRTIENLDIIPSRIQLGTIDLSRRAHREKVLYKQLSPILDQYKYVILDLPPMLSDLTNNGIYAADYILIPVKYEKDALDGIDYLFNIIEEIKEDSPFDYKILRNGCDGRKKTTNEFIERQLQPFVARGDVFKTIIHQDEEINKAKILDLPVLIHAPKCSASLDYIALTEEIKNG